MTQEQDHIPNSDLQDQDRIVAWLRLLDREELYDYQREVWKTLQISPSTPGELYRSGEIIRDPLTFEWSVPLSTSDVIQLLNQSDAGFEGSLYRKFGIESLDPMIGLPKGPYYDPVDIDRMKQDLQQALKKLTRSEDDISHSITNPLQSKISEAICFVKESIAERVRNEFGHDPDIFFKLAPSEFSRLVAELLRDMGADICTVGNPDLGNNIIAYFTLPTSQKVMTVVECKQSKKNRKIGPYQIQQFFFIAREHFHATQAMYVTTTHFTHQAKYWEEQHKWFLQLRDYEGLREWLDQYGQWEKSSSGGIWIPEGYKELGRVENNQSRSIDQHIVNNVLQNLAFSNPFIKILFLAANPINTSRLRLDEEFRSIDQALRQSEFRNRFGVSQQWAVRVDDLQEHLLRHKPNIVHFSGHGSNSSEIILEDNIGNSHAVSIPALTELFSILNNKVSCVVLNACYSEEQAKAIAKHVNYVIGMSKEIGDKSAISFSTAFYRALGYGQDIETAFKFGCSQINLRKLGDQVVPKLITLK